MPKFSNAELYPAWLVPRVSDLNATFGPHALVMVRVFHSDSGKTIVEYDRRKSPPMSIAEWQEKTKLRGKDFHKSNSDS